MLGLELTELRMRPPESATLALASRMSVAPDAARLSLIDAAVRGLKAGGVWAKLDGCWVMAAHDAGAARLNWAGPEYTLCAIGTPEFTADRGYCGEGAASCLDTGFVPGSGQTLRDSNHLAVWSLSAGDHGVAEAGCDMLSLCGRTAGNLLATRSASEITRTAANEEGAGLLALSRSSSGGYRWYRHGAVLADGVQESSAFSGLHSLYVCGRNASGVPAANPKRLAAVTLGGALSDAEQAVLHRALGAYLAAIGAA